MFYKVSVLSFFELLVGILAVGRCQDFKKQQKGSFSSENEKCHAYSKSKTKEDFYYEIYCT